MTLDHTTYDFHPFLVDQGLPCYEMPTDLAGLQQLGLSG